MVLLKLNLKLYLILQKLKTYSIATQIKMLKYVKNYSLHIIKVNNNKSTKVMINFGITCIIKVWIISEKLI